MCEVYTMARRLSRGETIILNKLFNEGKERYDPTPHKYFYNQLPA